MPTQGQLTVEQFLEKGYKRFENNLSLNRSAFGLQKRFDDELGKKYYITVWVYDYSKIDSAMGLRFAPDVQFVLKSTGEYVDIKLHQGTNTSVDSIETFYENLWKVLDCKYYELWSEA